MASLSFLLEREVIVTLAIIGAVIATLGSVLLNPKSRFPVKTARSVLRMGYVVTFGSIGLFIVAGFVG